MDWKEEILQGMNLIKEGCLENATWKECLACPFNYYCTATEYYPMGWPEQEE